MGGLGWKSSLQKVLTPGHRIDEVMRSDNRSAVLGGYRGDTPVLITAMRLPRDEADIVIRRFMEARYLENPNLLRVIDTGRADDLVYTVTETAEGTLASQTELTDRELWDLARDVTSGLRYLHSEGLVYCALRSETVYRSGGQWKLGDFHQLHLPGKAKLSETRPLMGRMPEAPPEAFEGLVSPEWDVWSFGVTMGKVIRRGGARSERMDNCMDALISRCLDSNPETRITIDALAAELATVEQTQPVVEEMWQPRHGVSPAPSYLGIEGGTAPSEPAEEPKASRRWLPFAIAGAALGIALTVFAVHRAGSPSPEPGMPDPTRNEPVASSQPSAKEPAKPAPAAPQAAGESDRTNPIANKPTSIQGLLNQWISSIRKRDVEGQIDCYAPIVTRFYGRRNVSIRELRAEKEKVFASIGEVKKFDISGIKVTPVNSEMAVANFKKTWDFGSTAGAEQDEMTIRYIDGGWKIAGETGKRVYWVRRATARR
jgi:hypothetical protein